MKPNEGQSQEGRAHLTILFIDKSFLKKRKPNLPLRGVELFNLQLARDLIQLRYPVTLVLEESWAATVRENIPAGGEPLLILKNRGNPILNGCSAAFRTIRKSFDVLLIGNVGNGLLPALYLMKQFRTFARCVLIANREAAPRFVRFFTDVPGHILAVNGIIARPFQQAGCPSVHVDYGIPNAADFSPRTAPADDAGPARFCVLGALDNAWKGADTALAAFRKLAPPIRDRCELHLASFEQPPSFPESNIVPYPWMSAEEIPALLRKMDVMLVPSRDEEVMRETFSQALVQGMLTGLPVIVSNRPILMEKVDQGGGLVFHNTDELAAAMTDLALNPARRRALGADARRIALDRYVWRTSVFASRYLEA